MLGQDVLPVTTPPPPLQKNKEDLPHYINTPLSVTQTQVQRSHKNSGYYSGKTNHLSKQIFWLLEMCEALLIRWCKSVSLTKWVVLSLWSGQALPAAPPSQTSLYNTWTHNTSAVSYKSWLLIPKICKLY